MSMQSPDPKITIPDEKPLIVQHEEIKARAKELEKKLAEVVEAHGDLSEIEAAASLIHKEREILNLKKEQVYAQVKEVLDSNFDADKKLELLSVLKEDLIPFLCKALGDANEYVRDRAASTLGKIGPDAKDAVPELINALSDKNGFVRVMAADALGNIGHNDPAAIKKLEEISVNDPVRPVKFTALEALNKLKRVS